MNPKIQGTVTVLGRIMLSIIFLMSAVGNKIPNFTGTAAYMKMEGVPAPEFMLMGAIFFLIAGSLSIMTGFQARPGAGLLLIFLVLATYYFHDFWTIADPDQAKMEMISFMKNMALMGSMLFIIANGSGPMSLDNLWSKNKEITGPVAA
ncbi:MAG: DoxX family protein [Pirellulales bacterium]|jgi:putative oxidoreductase